MLLVPLSKAVTLLAFCTYIALQFAVPLWLMNLQGLKKYGQGERCYIGTQTNIARSEIRGPWDVAIPKIHKLH